MRAGRGYQTSTAAVRAGARPRARCGASEHDWLVVIPPAGLQLDGATGATGHVLAELPLDRPRYTSVLGYRQPTQAMADQAETPTLHQIQAVALPAAAASHRAGRRAT
jgi:hypothetical protein